MIERYQKVFKALGETTRLKILKLLSVESFCVCELAAALDMLQPRISQHLKILKEAGLVSERKDAYWTYYSVEKELINEVFQEFGTFLDNPLIETPGFQPVAERIATLEDNEEVKKSKSRLKR
ncbi:metalloregulator ArsR/SmtB family transcription factor [Metallumcola ferriviriculae]|uniref:Metalloregulator ArsR/SmtB family transcription factor n=1 Tax=Metallumcola ferriviriculae TaxID=3039180 RepID=A0AAU0UM20_9FIRM|nr:metalloregulator ArsR/SmtB family transcription factor [Desulfitibacteraceae bacterium MK1]